MNDIIPLLVLLVLGVPLALAIWLIVRAVQSRARIEELSRRFGGLEAEVHALRSRWAEAGAFQTPPVPVASPAEPSTEKISPEPPILTETPAVSAPESPALATQVPFVEELKPPPPIYAQKTAAVPPPFPMRPEPEGAWPLGGAGPKIDWEQLMGVKLFAWLGGLALFLGVAFFVKYSFEHDLIPPEIRVAIGFVTGLALLIGGVLAHRRKQYQVGAQALCATGVVILYASAYACHSIYHFRFFGTVPTFLLMVLVTATAFLTAVRLNALVVAILGMLGGFLTPVLLSTGQDNPLGLFGYLAILDAGLILVALNRRWFFLPALAAVGTAIMQIAWAASFFEAEKYFEGNKILIPFSVLLGFSALFLAANWGARRREDLGWWLSGATLGLAAVALAFSAWFLDFPTLAQRPVLTFGFIFLIDAIVAALVLADEKVSPAQSFTGFAVFGLLNFWTTQSLSAALLNSALGIYFVFALGHSLWPVWYQHRHGVAPTALAGHVFPILTLALVLVPIFKLAELSFIVWPFILLVDVLAIVLAVLTATLLPVVAVLLLTLGATAELIFKIPSDLTGMPLSFFLVGGFAVFFFATSVWLVRRFSPDASQAGVRSQGYLAKSADVAAVLPGCSAILPFLLLIMATLRLPLMNPSPVFGLALLLVVLALGVTEMFSFEWMPAIALGGVTALECAWHFQWLNPANPKQPLGVVLAWYLIFYAAFILFPFLFLRRGAERMAPWGTAALAGVPQFFFVYRLVKLAWPNEVMGLLPAAFSIPALLALVVVLKSEPAQSTLRLPKLALFGGVALFFITLIFPIQFERQWLTIAWALEGTALLWLFHRVPHEGLRVTGVGLLAAAFVRLALNPAVLGYHPRAATPIWNWYLYTYGIATACLFIGTRLLRPGGAKILGLNPRAILASFGIILAFFLLNIEIADYFSAPGSTLTFEFRGNFRRDMTYSIAWGLYALGLLAYGIFKNLPPSRYAALGLLCVTLLKLFFHDLASLEQLYRIGAFVGVAIIAMLASFAYQRFYSVRAKPQEIKNEPVH